MDRVWWTVGFSAVATAIISLMLFGSPFAVLFLPVFAERHIGALGPWQDIFVVASASVALLWVAVVVRVGRNEANVLTPMIIVVCSALIGYASVIHISEARREAIVEAFGAECVSLTSMARSFYIAPRDWQFDLHGSAVKNGIPYAWSWREMDFYLLNDSTWPNVLPPSVAQCVSDERRDAAQERRGY